MAGLRTQNGSTVRRMGALTGDRHQHTGPRTVDEYVEWNARQLAKAPVSRRGAIKAFLGVSGGLVAAQYALADAAMAAGGGARGELGVAVAGRHLSFVMDDGGTPATAMALTAQLVTQDGTLPNGLKAWVDLGSRHGGYGTRVTADVVHLLGQYAIAGGPVASQYYVKARITGLKPDTVYHYRVQLSDGTTTGDAYFSTAPATALDGGHGGHGGGRGDGPVPQPFTFTAFADVGTDTAPTDPKWAWGQDPASVKAAGGTWPKGVFDNQYYKDDDPVAGPTGTDRQPATSMTNLMSTQKPRFTLLAGDICYADPSGSGLPADNSQALSNKAPVGKNEFNPYVWDVFLTQIEAQAAFTPWMFATGNHDMEPLYGNTEFLGGSANHGYASHAARLDLPRSGPSSCPSVYRFVYGNVGVISVDANDLSHEIQTNLGYSGGAQQRWLEETLKAWRTDPQVAPHVDFVVLFLHHCAFSTANNHASDGGVRGVLEPLCSTYQVDVVIQGHNHLMERTDPIRNGEKTKDAPDGATICPATDGTTYLCIGSGGRPRYPFRPAPSQDAPAPEGVTVTGEQALPEGQRYRGYDATGKENGSTQVVNSYVWSDAGTAVNSSGYPAGTKVAEVADWSQVRYDDYAFIAVDVAPAHRGRRTTFTIRTLADALPGSGKRVSEIDRITFERTAGAGLVGPGLVVPGH